MTDVMTPGPSTGRTALPLFDVADEAFAAHYAQDGFALLGEALTREEVAALNADALRLCRGDYGEIGGGGTTEEVRPAAELTDEEVLRRYLCIHFPHKVSPAAQVALHTPRIVEALVAVIGPNVKAMQSMLFI